MKKAKKTNTPYPSEIQRYRQDKWSQFGVVEDNNGEWVRYEDYLSTKLELDRLLNSSFITAVPSDVYESMKAELDELRKELETQTSKKNK